MANIKYMHVFGSSYIFIFTLNIREMILCNTEGLFVGIKFQRNVSIPNCLTASIIAHSFMHDIVYTVCIGRV